VAINPICAGISVLPGPPVRGRSLPHHGRPLAGHALAPGRGLTPRARAPSAGIRPRLAKQRTSSDFPLIVCCFEKVRFRTFSLERSPGVRVQPVDGHQLKMPPLAVIGASTQIDNESSSHGSVATVEGWSRFSVATDRQAAPRGERGHYPGAPICAAPRPCSGARSLCRKRERITKVGGPRGTAKHARADGQDKSSARSLPSPPE
jgi:hypothetical protein